MDAVLKNEQMFPRGTTVGAYAMAGFGGPMTPSGAPRGTPVTTAAVASDGTLTFTGLTPGALYWAVGPSPNFPYVSFEAPELPSGGGGGAVSSVNGRVGDVDGLAEQSGVDTQVATALTTAEEYTDASVEAAIATAEAYADAPPSVTVITGNHTLVPGDEGNTILECTSVSPQTITIPLDLAIAVNSQIQIDRIGSGSVTIAAAGGVTIEPPTSLSIASQYATVFLRKRAANVFILNGDTA